MGNLPDSGVRDSSLTGTRKESDALSELRHLLLAPEQNQLDRLEQRLDTKVPRSDLVTIEQALNAKHDQLIRLEQLLTQEKDKLSGIEGNVRDQQEEIRAIEQRLAAETEQLALLEEKFSNNLVTASDVSDVLPQAVRLRQKEDAKLSFALAPLIEDGFETSIKKSPEKIIGILSPHLGVLIKEYVSTAIRKLTEEINRVVDRSLTPQAMKWRIEAYMKGVSYAELFLSRTLRFRVEQIFLIQKDSGVLLCDVAKEQDAVLSHDAVSAMLTAIQAFVNDAFISDKKTEDLNFINVGEYKILIEHGSEAILAGVVKGASPPPNLSGLFKGTLDEIHLKFKDEFLSFKGDVSIFHSATPYLEKCLIEELNEEFVPKEKKSSWSLMIGGTALLLFVIWFLFFQESETKQLKEILDKVKSQQGVISASISQGGEQGQVLRVLRDNKMTDVSNRVTTIVEKEEIDIPIKQYVAMDSTDIQKFSVLALAPPATATLTVQDDVLVAKGVASHDWIARLEHARMLLPGINRIDRSQLVDKDLQAFEDLKNQIESYEVRFEQGRASLSSEARKELKVFSAKIHTLDNVLQRLSKRGKIEVYGQTSPEGSVSRNQRIASERANNVIDVLKVPDLEALQVVPVSLVSRDEFTSELSDEDLSRKRRISLRVIVNE